MWKYHKINRKRVNSELGNIAMKKKKEQNKMNAEKVKKMHTGKKLRRT